MRSPKKISTVQNNGIEEPIESVINNKQVKYIVVRHEGEYADSYSTYDDFEEEVNSKLEEGWIPCGGVSIGYLGNEHFCICQAMIKEEKE